MDKNQRNKGGNVENWVVIFINFRSDMKKSCEIETKIEFKTHEDMLKVMETNGRPKAKYVV